MKITTDPMPVLRIAARDKVDMMFNDLAQRTLHRDAARAAKRLAAERLLGGESIATLDAEAALRGISPVELALIIADKTDELQGREDRRQRIFKAIEEAATPQALDDLIANLRSF
jgi:hypothetical protein